MKLKRIKNTNDKDYIPGLVILNKYMTENTSVNTNEMTYWINNYNNRFRDKLYCYVIKQDDIVVGWFQFVYFKDKFILIDYLVIEKQYRNKEIYNHITSIFNKLKCFNVVVESGNDLNQHDAIIRLYEIMGFNKFNVSYIEPKLNVMLSNQTFNWLSVESTLMYRGISINNPKQIIEVIYREHYARWYSLYCFDLTEYHQFLNHIIENIV